MLTYIYFVLRGSVCIWQNVLLPLLDVGGESALTRLEVQLVGGAPRNERPRPKGSVRLHACTWPSKWYTILIVVVAGHIEKDTWNKG
jgi:hypothetical protein